MGRPRKTRAESQSSAADIETRDPLPTTRDPAAKARHPRRYIPAAQPVICPDCGRNTRMDDGRHVDPVRRKILEYRTCCWCGAKLAAGRDMTAHEVDQLCSRAEAVAEYERAER